MIDWKNVPDTFRVTVNGVKLIPGGTAMAIQEDGTLVPAMPAQEIHPVFLASDEPIIEKPE